MRLIVDVLLFVCACFGVCWILVLCLLFVLFVFLACVYVLRLRVVCCLFARVRKSFVVLHVYACVLVRVYVFFCWGCRVLIC